ncbi:MAG: sulfatase-like hydrolase/transferase [Armatimonadota bacterium]
MTNSGPRTSGKRPNVLFLFADDQRFDTINALGNADVITPTLDALAERGTALPHAHIMGSTLGAVCVCSRASLITGRGLFRAGELPLRGGPEALEGLAIWPEVMQHAGYATFGTGKWHNAVEAYARGFTHGGNIFFGGMSNHLEVPIHDFNPAGEYPKEASYTGGKFSSELFSDAAVEFLSSYTGEEPFFMYVSFTAPHDPRMAPKEYADRYKPDALPVPENFMPEHPFDNGEMRIRDEKLAPWPRTPEIVREHLAAYYAMITHLDAQMGRVLRTLEETGHGDDTIVIFAGDNGLAVGQHGLMGKQSLYEHSVRVPLIISGPGIPAGERRDGLCYLHDVFPTVCELAHIAVPESVDSRSLVPLITGSEGKLRDSVYGAYKGIHRMVRDDRHKLIEYSVKGTRTTQLFDLSADPWEINNLADDPEHAAHVARLREELGKWQKAEDDPLADKWPSSTE